MVWFDTIPKDRLLALVKEHISDSRMLTLIKLFPDQNILEELREWTPLTGVPQGAVLSPVLSNLYLDPLDHAMADNGFEMVRYADDFVVLCRSEFEAEVALQMISEWVESAGLTLHPTKTKIVDSRVESFAFWVTRFAETRFILVARATRRVYRVLIAGRMTSLRKRACTVCAKPTFVSINP